MNKKLLTSVLLIASSCIFVGCGNQKMSNEEQSKFVNKINEEVVQSVNINKLEDEIDKNINKLSKDNASQVVNSYIYRLYQLNTDYLPVLNDLKPLMKDVEAQKKIDLTNSHSHVKLDDGLVKGFKEQLDNDHLKLRKDSGNFYISVDMEYVLKRYGDNVSPDLKKFMEFRENEDSKKIFSSETETFDLDEICERIVTIEKNMKEYKDSKYINQWKSSLEYYYNIIFETNHTFFNDKNDSIKKDILEKYEKYVEKYKGTQFSDDLKKIVDILKEKNDTSDSKYVETVNDIFNKKFKSNDSNPDSEKVGVDKLPKAQKEEKK